MTTALRASSVAGSIERSQDASGRTASVMVATIATIIASQSSDSARTVEKVWKVVKSVGGSLELRGAGAEKLKARMTEYLEQKERLKETQTFTERMKMKLRMA